MSQYRDAQTIVRGSVLGPAWHAQASQAGRHRPATTVALRRRIRTNLHHYLHNTWIKACLGGSGSRNSSRPVFESRERRT